VDHKADEHEAVEARAALQAGIERAKELVVEARQTLLSAEPVDSAEPDELPEPKPAPPMT
jgi:hypothetical protein